MSKDDRDWRRGELANLERTFPGMTWETEILDLDRDAMRGRCGNLWVLAYWTGPLQEPHRFVVELGSGTDDPAIQAESQHPWDAIRSAKLQLLALYGTIAQAVQPPEEVLVRFVVAPSNSRPGELSIRAFDRTKDRLSASAVGRAFGEALRSIGAESGDSVVVRVRKEKTA